MLLQFDPESHTYTLGGQVVPSVTQVIAPIRPDFSMVPPAILEAKRALGVAVHAACEYDDDGDLDEDSLSDHLRPYLAAWRKFRADTGAAIVMNERQIGHPTLYFAGTLDRLATIDGETWLLDLKTAADSHPSFGVQLAGYECLLIADGYHGAQVKRASVHLREDGSYRLHQYKNPNDAIVFRALLSVQQWKDSNK